MMTVSTDLSQALQCSFVRDETALDALIPEWEALQRRAGRNIFTSAYWCCEWWRCIGREQGWQLHVAVGRRDGKVMAIAPLAVIRRKGVRLLQWAAGEACDYSDFLLEAPEDGPALLRALRQSPHYDLALLREVSPEAYCLPALEAAASLSAVSHARNLQMRERTFGEWFALLPYAVRKQHRARLKQGAARGGLQYEIITDARVQEAALAALIAQKRQWLAGVGKSGMVDAPGIQAFYRAVVDASCQDGTLHLSTLRCAGDISAVHLGFVQQGRFLSYMPSYDSRWSALSPGRIMLFHCLEWAFSHGCREYDFMRGGEDYKQVFADDARVLKDFMFARTLKGRLAKFAYLRRAARKLGK